MRAGRFESINATQLATATDRLLAYGLCKRRGPHVAYTIEPRVASTDVEETTEIVRRPATRAQKRGLASRLLAAAAVVGLLCGAVIGIRSARATPAHGTQVHLAGSTPGDSQPGMDARGMRSVQGARRNSASTRR